eukprot:200937-Pelagomonas_calceolata.AAC.1
MSQGGTSCHSSDTGGLSVAGSEGRKGWNVGKGMDTGAQNACFGPLRCMPAASMHHQTKVSVHHISVNLDGTLLPLPQKGRTLTISERAKGSVSTYLACRHVVCAVMYLQGVQQLMQLDGQSQLQPAQPHTEVWTKSKVQ